MKATDALKCGALSGAVAELPLQASEFPLYGIMCGMVLRDNPQAYAIMGCAKRVYDTLGFGFLESAYGDALEIEFQNSGIPHVREDPVRIWYKGIELPTCWRADFTCFNREIIVELKAIKAITKIEWAQVVHYLKATRIPYALLVSFGGPKFQYDTFALDDIRSVAKKQPLA